jgi:phosphoadenosine phosphosulfate reductase
MSAVGDTLHALQAAREKSDKVLVAFSGGKDSLATLDLCVRTFRVVEAFFMYLVPGLRCQQVMLDAARARWGVTIREYPHWLGAKLMRSGVYCKTHWRRDDVPLLKLRDIYDMASAEARIPLIATGAKRADSLWRKRNLAQTAHYDDVLYPVISWTKQDVLAYLRVRGIPIPESSKGSATGIDLSTPSLLWLYDNHPDDFARLCEFFPFAEAAVWRRRFHGEA